MVDMARGASSQPSVSEYLSLDHDRLDLLLLEVIKLVSARRFNEARPKLSNFAFELRRHICLEDDVVPLCEEGVRGLVGNGASNAGGRLTKECRSLLSGLKPKARVQMKNLMRSIENAEEFTREARGLSRIVKLLIPCLEPAPGICEDNAAG